jgi:hypothetical protein
LITPIEITYKNQQDSLSNQQTMVYDFEKINEPISFSPAIYMFKNNGCKIKDVEIKKNKNHTRQMNGVKFGKE